MPAPEPETAQEAEPETAGAGRPVPLAPQRRQAVLGCCARPGRGASPTSAAARAREPLWRVHECVFGVLALESEPVDPRL